MTTTFKKRADEVVGAAAVILITVVRKMVQQLPYLRSGNWDRSVQQRLEGKIMSVIIHLKAGIQNSVS